LSGFPALARRIVDRNEEVSPKSGDRSARLKTGTPPAEERRALGLIYWWAEDDLAVIDMALSALSIYFAFDITRVAKGAPRAWYFIIGGFAVFFVFRAVQLYFDVQVPADIISIEEELISLLAGILFAIGLFTLDRRFRAQQKAAQGN